MNENIKQFYLVEISGTSCPSCAALKSNIEEIIGEFPMVTYYYVDDENTSRTYIEQLHLEQLPALVLIGGGKIVGIAYGGQPPEILREWLQAKLKDGGQKNGK